IEGARIFTGTGKVIESGAALVKSGKIERVYTESAPDLGKLRADVVPAEGKTLLPGLIDAHIHLGSPGGSYDTAAAFDAASNVRRALAAYLYSGVTAVRSAGDFLDQMLETRALIGSGRRLGAELFICGPMFTAEGGHGTEYIEHMPEFLKERARAQMVRTPKTPDEARRQVRALKQAGVDGIKAILEAGWPGRRFPRLDTAIFQAIAEEARAQKLPLAVHTGTARDVAEALDAGAAGIEHGSFSEAIPEGLFARMARAGVDYDPTLSVVNAFAQNQEGKLKLLSRSLVLQVGPKALIEMTKRSVQKDGGPKVPETGPAIAAKNLMRAYRAGVPLVAGSDAGNPLVIHGPTVQQELALWVQAGIPPAAALQAATRNAARLLRAENRIGTIEAGREANLLLVDGDPLADISATERISLVVYKGERIRRAGLFDQK
ncbi:MAG TPA: amidohydrolase family protein, partial [Bryobacteraceae bacterium]|nr:amidohydrolase family protein [Bryobacteraceae bacterium]